MKKWAIVLVTLVVLGGCASGTEEKAGSSEKVSESKEVVESSVPKASELVESSFDIEGTVYKINILERWKEQPKEEGISFNVGNATGSEAVISYGVKKTDIDSFEIFKELVTDQIISVDEFDVQEDEIEKSSYQTTHYTGDLYVFTEKSEGVKIEIRYYFLETDTDYVVINVLGVPSFFEKNDETVTEILNSFVAG
ncbi:hypothetical protein LI951_02935 [Enterococcus sp. BWT-B8]|uniref:hypothetical protein n=1 Tax=Enterococcus sp. BWT-B8 TaxID=2885157 RepID=UPI001E5858D6|nr:hypothetical protein [Enterococcus sp. BWT-B8]MCB5951015.1 hypothetical protein [Enterococcus sp. BWT-B8]